MPTLSAVEGMATYTHRFIPATGTDPDISLFHVVERPLYGSSRLGVDAQEVDLGPATPTAPTTAHPGQWRYELTDHLGNVQAVVTEELLGLDATNDQSVDQWAPVLVSAQDYEPGGSLLPGRNYSSDSYRFGFQGQEKDDEMHGATGTSFAFEYRMHDARIGRFFSVDPLSAKYPWNSPFSFSENDVIRCIDMEGLERIISIYNEQTGHRTSLSLSSPGSLGEGVLAISYAGHNMFRLHYQPDVDVFGDAHQGSGVPHISMLWRDPAIARSVYESRILPTDIKSEIFNRSVFNKNDHKLRRINDLLETTGDYLEVSGTLITTSIVGAPVGAAMVATGEIISNTGLGLNLFMDYAEGDTEKLGKRMLLNAVSLGISGVLGKMKNRVIRQNDGTGMFLHDGLVIQKNEFENAYKEHNIDDN